MTDTYRYTAYGELYAQSGLGTTNNYLYTGQQYDSLTGLYSLRARYYDPSIGRFLTRDTWPLDTFNPVELNRYQYGMSNPIRFSDPSGYSPFAELGKTISAMLTMLTWQVRYYYYLAVATYTQVTIWLSRLSPVFCFATEFATDLPLDDLSCGSSFPGRTNADANGNRWWKPWKWWGNGNKTPDAPDIDIDVPNPRCPICVQFDDPDLPSGRNSAEPELPDINTNKNTELPDVDANSTNGNQNNDVLDVDGNTSNADFDGSPPSGVFNNPNTPGDPQNPFFVRYDPNNPGQPDPNWAIDTSLFDPPGVAPDAVWTGHGEIRDFRQFWQAWQELDQRLGRQTLSQTNLDHIRFGRAPRVDDTWVEYFREHAPFNIPNQIITHHHVGYGEWAIPLPRDLHLGAGNTGYWHPPDSD